MNTNWRFPKAINGQVDNKCLPSVCIILSNEDPSLMSSFSLNARKRGGLCDVSLWFSFQEPWVLLSGLPFIPRTSGDDLLVQHKSPFFLV